jgi:uncharacterized integral membrane protein (TIGR00697 family)
MPTSMSRETKLLLVLSAVLVSSAVVAELVAVKLFEVRFYAWLGFDTTFTLTCGSLLWPLVFLTTDVVNEFFGHRLVRFVTWVTIAMISWTFLVTNLSMYVPAASFSPVDDATFGRVFGQSAWIIVGSMAAFLMSQLVDVTVFHRIRKALGGRHIWARATGSTIASQVFDSFIVIYVAFWLPGVLGVSRAGADPISAAKALEISLSSFTYKVGVAIAVTPLVYASHWVVEWWLGHDEAKRLAQEASEAA